MLRVCFLTQSEVTSCILCRVCVSMFAEGRTFRWG